MGQPVRWSIALVLSRGATFKAPVDYALCDPEFKLKQTATAPVDTDFLSSQCTVLRIAIQMQSKAASIKSMAASKVQQVGVTLGKNWLISNEVLFNLHCCRSEWGCLFSVQAASGF